MTFSTDVRDQRSNVDHERASGKASLAYRSQIVDIDNHAFPCLGCIFRTNEPVNTLKLLRLRLLKFNKCAWFDDTFLFGYEVMLDALTRLTPLK